MTNIFAKSAAAIAMLGLAGAAHAGSYESMDVVDGGSFVGTVSAGENTNDSRDYTISKDTDICGEGTRTVNFVEVSEAGMLMNAVVFLVDVDAGKPFADGMESLTIEQRACEFSPALGVMANRGEFTAVNDDHTLHNIHTYEQIGSARRSVMNVSQPEAGDTVTKQIKLRRGNGMKVECDAHDFMHAFVYVAKNPYFAVVDENGAFEIDDIPAGTYEVMMWHGFLGEVEVGEITVDAAGEVSMDLSY